ncbi:hypothetical protein [Lysobacter gummosus]
MAARPLFQRGSFAPNSPRHCVNRGQTFIQSCPRPPSHANISA